MNIEKEIQKIAEYQNAIIPRHERKNEQAISDILANTIASYENKTKFSATFGCNEYIFLY